MSDDEEMTDLSQAITQSGSLTLTSLSLSNRETEREPWGQIIIYKISRKRLGTTALAKLQKQQQHIFELVEERNTFGRKGESNIVNLNISRFIEQNRVNEISGIHFTITKTNVKDPLCPVFLEDSSQNGTYFSQKGATNVDLKGFNTFERIDEKVKRRIMAHKDVIYIEKRPTICFEFHTLQHNFNDLPNELNVDYHIGHILGRGACGTVYCVLNRRTCQPFALKYTDNDGDENRVTTIMKEVEIMRGLTHPCILKLHKMQTYIDSVAILIEFMAGGDLITRIQNAEKKFFSERLTKFVFYQICCGVQYLHDRNVTHRDLKPENILLATTDEYTLVKVSDFGLSKCANANSLLQTQCGTRMYLAPEVRSAQRYTNKVDIWSLGVILFNCFTGKYPFHDHSKNYQLKLRHEQWNNVSEDGKNIVRQTLQKDADLRPSAQQLLSQRRWLSKDDQIIQKACEIISNPDKQSCCV